LKSVISEGHKHKWENSWLPFEVLIIVFIIYTSTVYTYRLVLSFVVIKGAPDILHRYLLLKIFF